MEFIRQNYLLTSTMIAVNSNTGTAANLFTRDPYYQYYSDGLNNDATTCSITVTFDATTSVSRIALLDTNFKGFRFFYNGATANSFSFTNADTTTSIYSANTDENKYFKFATIAVSSITFECQSTQLANQEKRLGLLVLSDLNVSLSKIPSAQQYKPRRVPKQVVHKLSDGGTRINTVRRKFETSFSLDYIDDTEKDLLYNLWYDDAPFNFVALGTATGWSGILFECVWDGSFDFDEYSDNATSAGFSGKISLKETPS